MQRIRLGYDFAHPPEIVWRYLLDHEGMIRWSGLDQVELLRSVGGGGVGSVRRVSYSPYGLPGLGIEEEICGALKEERLEYRIIKGLPLRHHYGIIGLEKVGTGTRLSWRVNFIAKIPGLGRVIKAMWESLLRDALKRLDRLMRAEYSVVGADLRGQLLSGEDVLWRQRARDHCERLRETALRFKKCGSPHYWFARSYLNVQDSALALVDQGHFIQPGWVLRLFVRFHQIFESNLLAWESGHRAEVEFHWEEAFSAAELGGKWWINQAEGIAHALRRAAWAHLVEDLPRALSTTYWEYYSKVEGLDYESFAEDFYRLHPVFEAGERGLKSELPKPTFQESVLNQMVPRMIRRRIFQQNIFDIRRERRRAWERGRNLVRLLADPDGRHGTRFPKGVVDSHGSAGA
jgi:hypothetical protein